MNQTRTPGPWKSYTKGQIVEVWGPEKKSSVAVVKWNGFDGCNRPLAEQRANAKLIAAAPDLLAACQAALRWSQTPESEEGGDFGTFAERIVPMIAGAIHKAGS